MTKEELKQEAEEYLKKHNYTSGYIGYFASGYCEQAYIDSAEPREKRIEELEQKLETERSSRIALVNKIAELEAQIEKMKCCAKCSHCNTYITSCIPRKRFVKLEDVCKDFELRR